MLQTIVVLLLLLPALTAGGESLRRAERVAADGALGGTPGTSSSIGTMSSIGSSERGALLSAEKIDARSASQIGATLWSKGIQETALTGGAIYRIVYQTIDVHGQPATASGALAIPDDRSGPLPVISYQHGTVLDRKGVASVYGFDLPTMMLLGAGYVVAEPDYLGLGASPGMHPYVHAASLASAVVDMLRASRALCARESVVLDRRVFLMGYSEGGFATMAAAREIERSHASEFTLAGVAPMAGPYDMSGVMYRLLMSDRSYSHPFYLPYVVLGYDQAYDLYDSLGDVFRDRYVGTIQTIFTSGNYDLARQLPSVPRLMLTDDFLAAFGKDARHPLRAALAENDLTGWRPTAPMRLYHGTADEQVPYENATVALREFHARGAAQVELVSLKGASHGSGALPSFIGARRWFDSLRGAGMAR